VAWAVDVCVVAGIRFIFYMCRVNGDTASPFFWSLVNASIIFVLCLPLFSKNLFNISWLGRKGEREREREREEGTLTGWLERERGEEAEE
jgi:hypothetical protein